MADFFKSNDRNDINFSGNKGGGYSSKFREFFDLDSSATSEQIKNIVTFTQESINNKEVPMSYNQEALYVKVGEDDHIKKLLLDKQFKCAVLPLGTVKPYKAIDLSTMAKMKNILPKVFVDGEGNIWNPQA